MKHLKKWIALLMAALMLCTVFAVPALAATGVSGTDYSVGEKIEHVFYRFVDKLISVLGRFLNAVIPGLNWRGKIPYLKNYQTANFYPGETAFDAAPAENAKWSMGFAERSFLTGLDPMDGSYYLVGTLEPFKGRVPTEVLDDQGVNTYALSDGDTTVVYASIDGYGLARGDVMEIRSRLAAFAEEKGIDSINVGALHQHSLIDTLGLGTPIVPAVFVNPAATLFNEDLIRSGRNKTFMEAVYAAVTESVVEAVENMTEGALYYGSVNASDFIRDKRDPQVFDPDIHRLRFVPDDANANEIWVWEAGIHCVSLGAGPTEMTSDFPYYVEQYVREQTGNKTDLVFIEGAELAITSKGDAFVNEGEDTPVNHLKTMGRVMGGRLMSVADEEALPALLNVAHREVQIEVQNPIHTLAGREGMLGSVFCRTLTGYTLITEIGYMELGGKLGVILAPGELEPAVVWGGATEARDSWTGESWDYAPLAETCGAQKLICFGLCNDQIGYILCDNDVRSMLTENEEINAVSFNSGSTLTKAYEALFAEIR